MMRAKGDAHLLQLGQLLDADHVHVGALVALPNQRRQLRPQQLPRPVHVHCACVPEANQCVVKISPDGPALSVCCEHVYL